MVHQTACQGAMKAWKVYVKDWGKEPLGLTMASTRGKALARSYRSARESGYAIHWVDFRIIRAPEFDDAHLKHGEFNWDYDYAMRMLSGEL